MFVSYDSVLGCLCLAPSELLGVYPMQSKTVLVDLQLPDWQSLGGFFVPRIVRVV
jgi:hypothetical protein